MIFKELSDRDQWIHMKDIQVPEHKGLEYKCYMVFEQKLLSLYAVVTHYGKKLYDAKWKDFAINVFSLVVEKTFYGRPVMTMEFLTGMSDNTIDAAISALEKNYLDFVDDMTRIEVTLEKFGIPYVKDLDQIAKSYVRGRIKIVKPELKKHFANKNFKIDLTAGDMLLSEMFSAASRMRAISYAKRISKERHAEKEVAATEDYDRLMRQGSNYDTDKFTTR